MYFSCNCVTFRIGKSPSLLVNYLWFWSVNKIIWWLSFVEPQPCFRQKLKELKEACVFCVSSRLKCCEKVTNYNLPLLTVNTVYTCRHTCRDCFYPHRSNPVLIAFIILFTSESTSSFLTDELNSSLLMTHCRAEPPVQCPRFLSGRLWLT